MPNSTRFLTLVIVAAIAGFLTETVVNAVWDTPEIVDWCIAGSVGYIAAELAELVLEYTGKVRPDGKAR